MNTSTIPGTPQNGAATNHVTVRKSGERGYFDHGWLKTYHTFSFAGYQDLKHMGFRSLRVMNEDFVAPGSGFGKHPHHDMEIITYVISGTLAHEDSMGNIATIEAGEFQRMSAGSGIYHSEFNHSENTPVHLYQIWIKPREKGIEPGYEQVRLEQSDTIENKLGLIASPEPGKGLLTINQDANIYMGRFAPNRLLDLPIDKDRHYWLQVIEGELAWNSLSLKAGDGIHWSGTFNDAFQILQSTQVMLFELT